MLTEYRYVGFESKDSEDTEDDSEDTEDDSSSAIKDFREKNCKAKDGSDEKIFVDANGNEMNLDEIKKKYPNLKFDGDDCNPCSEDCSFSISDGEEQITVEEGMRPKDSSEMFVSRPNTDTS